jgi:hypothetical protein
MEGTEVQDLTTIASAFLSPDSSRLFYRSELKTLKAKCKDFCQAGNKKAGF